MDTGIQLGRRFRALKLWMVLRHFGADGLRARLPEDTPPARPVSSRVRARLAEHIRLAGLFASWVDASPDFERLAPVPFSVVCFRARARQNESADALNERVLESVNATGEMFIYTQAL